MYMTWLLFHFCPSPIVYILNLAKLAHFLNTSKFTSCITLPLRLCKPDLLFISATANFCTFATQSTTLLNDASNMASLLWSQPKTNQQTYKKQQQQQQKQTLKTLSCGLALIAEVQKFGVCSANLWLAIKSGRVIVYHKGGNLKNNGHWGETKI